MAALTDNDIISEYRDAVEYLGDTDIVCIIVEDDVFYKTRAFLRDPSPQEWGHRHHGRVLRQASGRRPGLSHAAPVEAHLGWRPAYMGRASRRRGVQERLSTVRPVSQATVRAAPRGPCWGLQGLIGRHRSGRPGSARRAVPVPPWSALVGIRGLGGCGKPSP